MDDISLVELIKQKDHNAFRELVEKYQSLVLNTCNSFLHNYDDSQDIAQEVFVEVYRSIDKFRMESKLSTWLYRISVNKSINYLRDTKKSKWFFNIDILFEKDNGQEENHLDDSPHEIMENQEKTKILYDAIDNLPENQKIAFTLYKYDDLSYKEISEVMEISLSSVESLMFRAKRNLQKKLISIYKKK